MGGGQIGGAIVGCRAHGPQGFRFVEAFASAPRLAGTEIDGALVKPRAELEDVLRASPVDVGIVAVPAEIAQDVVDALVRSGVGAILNYAPIAARVPSGVYVRRIDPVLSLQSMTYYLKPKGPVSSGRPVPKSSR